MKPKFSTLCLAVFVAGCATAGPRFATGPIEVEPLPPVPQVSSPVATAVIDDGWSPVLAVGPQTLAAFPNTPPAAMETIQLGHRQPTAHVVAPGETLFAIAREHLGSGGRWRELVDANPRLSASANVQVGQIVMVP